MFITSSFLSLSTKFSMSSISLKPYDVTPCLPCCIVGLFGGNVDFNMNRIVMTREEYLKSAILIF